MASPGKFFAGLAGLLGAVVAGLVWQGRANATLRDTLREHQARARAQTALAGENQRLKSEGVTAQEMAGRREERAALVALAAELETMRRRMGTAAPAGNASPDPAVPRPSLREAELGAAVWENPGRRDPLSALETALWAAAHGDLGTLTDLLIISETTRAQAAAVMTRLPDAVRDEVSSPEQLVAMLSASAIPLGTAEVIGEFNDNPGSARLLLHLTAPGGQSSVHLLTLHSTTGGWRLVVPDAEIARYFAKLRSPAGP